MVVLAALLGMMACMMIVVDNFAGNRLITAVCNVPFSSSLDGWRIVGDAVDGYPTIIFGYADVRFQTYPGDAYFTHDPYRITGGVEYRLLCKVKAFNFQVYSIPFSLIFDRGDTISGFITDTNTGSFILFEQMFTAPEGARTLTLEFGPNAPNFMMQNLLIEAVE